MALTAAYSSATTRVAIRGVDERHLHLAVSICGAAMASSRMPRLKLGDQRVPQPVGVHAGDPGGPADAGDDVAVQRAAVVGDQALAVAYVLEVGRGPDCQRSLAGPLRAARRAASP